MILKGRGEMNPLISLVAIFGGLQMFGLFGVFIGPIMLAVVVSLLQIWPRVAKSFGLRFDEEV
jgi:predicted PurR-regulated permease PerM